MKGQTQVVSVVLISGILIGVVSSVYFWGVPLIQKNRDISILESSEHLMRALNEKVKSVANNGGRDKITITGPGIMRFDPSDGVFSYSIETEGTVYAANAEVPLGRNSCSDQSGEWGKKESDILCVKSTGESRYTTTYYLRYMRLDSGARSFAIKLDGERSVSGESHEIILENVGTSESSLDGIVLINTVVGVLIV